MRALQQAYYYVNVEIPITSARNVETETGKTGLLDLRIRERETVIKNARTERKVPICAFNAVERDFANTDEGKHRGAFNVAFGRLMSSGKGLWLHALL